jgi:tetratricopeptide (TPR) repeat protein
VLIVLHILSSSIVVAQTAPDLSGPRARIEAGEYASAIARLEAFIKARPQDADARYLLARAYYLQGGLANLERAEESVRSAIRITGSKPEYEWLYGLILVGQGKTGAGLSRLRVAASGDPRGPSAPNVYRYAMDWGLVAWREGDTRQALEAFARASRAAPDQPWPLIHQGSILLSVREPEQALTALTRAISTLERGNAPKSHPGFSAAYYWRGRVYEALGKFIEARSDYTAALDHDPSFAPAKEALEGVSAR